ncbi:hypothetical protein ACM7Y8_004815 [Escherichia coli]|nr:hypothetical protein [Escherichia coli]HAH8492561.1 hypothetical protein [Escherichia coli]HAL6710441.1 hypothetical protein [Escherichia coli]HDQ4267871.1 hypothetical protein [Escherichia coli]
MSNNRGSSQGLTQKGSVCKKGPRVTDQFYTMIIPAFEATKQVLQTRAENLEAWTPKDQRIFSDIFGLEGDTSITIDYYLPLQRPDKNEKFHPLHIDITAHEFIKSGVNRMIDICNSLIIGTRIQEGSQILYGNFINSTDRKDGSARIPPAQTLHINLNDQKYKIDEYKNKSKVDILKAEYRDKITVEILQNFTCKEKTGEQSHVSTICHELSHLFIIRDGNQYYGGLSSDDLGKGRELSNAGELKTAHDKLVFKNAYNIEKYFEIN